jgi:hypothetical protein
MDIDFVDTWRAHRLLCIPNQGFKVSHGKVKTKEGVTSYQTLTRGEVLLSSGEILRRCFSGLSRGNRFFQIETLRFLRWDSQSIRTTRVEKHPIFFMWDKTEDRLWGPNQLVRDKDSTWWAKVGFVYFVTAQQNDAFHAKWQLFPTILCWLFLKKKNK